MRLKQPSDVIKSLMFKLICVEGAANKITGYCIFYMEITKNILSNVISENVHVFAAIVKVVRG